MSFMSSMDQRAGRMNTFDIGHIKLAVAAFILMIAKLWEPILSLDWYWYGIIFVLAMLKPSFKYFK